MNKQLLQCKLLSKSLEKRSWKCNQNRTLLESSSILYPTMSINLTKAFLYEFCFDVTERRQNDLQRTEGRITQDHPRASWKLVKTGKRAGFPHAVPEAEAVHREKQKSTGPGTATTPGHWRLWDGSLALGCRAGTTGWQLQLRISVELAKPVTQTPRPWKPLTNDILCLRILKVLNPARTLKAFS